MPFAFDQNQKAFRTVTKAGDVVPGPWGPRPQYGPPGATSFGGQGVLGLNALHRYGAAPDLSNVIATPLAKEALGQK